jgi:nucleoside-diphosphate-sugar epimerase
MQIAYALNYPQRSPPVSSDAIATPNLWTDRHSPINPSSERGTAESELLALDQASTPTTVLDLSGLWGGTRDPRNWVQRVAPAKAALRNKVSKKLTLPNTVILFLFQGSVHLIHGEDVARAILAVHSNWDKSAGQRWLLTDGRVYDWWSLASAWGNVHSTPGIPRRPPAVTDTEADEPQPEDALRGPQPRWVRELMREDGVRGLPRSMERLGRALDSREFWETFELDPEFTLIG